MEFFHLFRFLVSLDTLSLRSLRKRVPDFQEVLNSPRAALQAREIEIGPWTRYVRSIVVPILLLVPVMLGGVLIGELAGPNFAQPMAIFSLVAWLVLSAWVILAGRGGVCLLSGAGVEFRHRGVAVFCPWDVFHVAGQPVYYPDQHRLDLPVQQAAIRNIEVRKDDAVIAEGQDAQASHFTILPTGEIRLKVVYGVNPKELGLFLLELGGKLGRPLGQATQEALVPAPVAARAEEDGWIRVNLTRLSFPPLCCDCCQTADSSQEFHGYRSLFSKDVSMSVDDSLTVQAPVCSHCQGVNSGRYWRTLLKTIFLVAFGTTVISFLVGAVLDLCGVPGTMACMMSVLCFSCSLPFSWVIAAKRANTACAPVFLSDYRPGEGTIRVRFRSSKYAELFLGAI